MAQLRLDELAQRAGVASTTVRLYQSKGLLAPPRLEGRTGWYDESHLRRLELIGRLQDQGFSLSGIATLIECWESGRSIDAIFGVEAELDALLRDAHAVVLDAQELQERLQEGALTPQLVQRAVELGLVQPTEDAEFRVPDRRFLDTGAALADLGVPPEVILDEWEALKAHTDEIAERFLSLFEKHLVPDDWESRRDPDAAAQITETLARLRPLARQILAAALDASIAERGRQRLGSLLAEAQGRAVG